MDILALLLLLVIGVVCVLFLALAGLIAVFSLYLFWPVILGLALGILVWVKGHDNLGVILALALFLLQYRWIKIVKAIHIYHIKKMVAESSSSLGYETFSPRLKANFKNEVKGSVEE